MKVSWSSEDKPGICTPGLEHEIIVKSQSPSHSFDVVIPSVCVVQADLCVPDWGMKRKKWASSSVWTGTALLHSSTLTQTWIQPPWLMASHERNGPEITLTTYRGDTGSNLHFFPSFFLSFFSPMLSVDQNVTHTHTYTQKSLILCQLKNIISIINLQF